MVNKKMETIQWSQVFLAGSLASLGTILIQLLKPPGQSELEAVLEIDEDDRDYYPEDNYGIRLMSSESDEN